MFTRDDIVRALVRSGTTLARAEALVAKKLGPAEIAVDVDEHALEKTEQHEVTKLFRAFGFRVWSTSQARAAKVSAGLPDLIVMHERLDVGFFFEVKRQLGGRFSPEQIEFGQFAGRCGMGYHSGDRHDAADLIVAHGLATRTAIGTLEPTRLGAA